MDPRERLRLALLGAGCAKCGQPYVASGIRVLAQREEIAFVELVCFACQTQTMALVTGGTAAAGRSRAQGESVLGEYPPDGEDDLLPDPDAGHPLSETDVLEMRSFLAGYEGDLHGLLGSAPDESEGDGERDRGGRA